MTRPYYLIEEELPPKLPVVFSPEIIQEMDSIEDYNQDNPNAAFCIDIHF